MQVQYLKDSLHHMKTFFSTFQTTNLKHVFTRTVPKIYVSSKPFSEKCLYRLTVTSIKVNQT